MPLKEYKRKRDFKKTAEPAGATPLPTRGHHYVIQKHAASRLHYDFRLELDGTLKSWAVPKGPSLDPAVKSLAVQVEDHPLEYATFEGIIPEGQYGGGTVMVWDHGTWEPEVDPRKGMKNGKLKFELHGEKLHGSWALVRMGGHAGAGGKNWLLIKHQDAAAKPSSKLNILEREPRSVITDRDLDEIASDSDSVWSSKSKVAHNGRHTSTTNLSLSKSTARKSNAKTNRKSAKAVAANFSKLPDARRAPLPTHFKPQLATLASQVPDTEEWLYELKFDGYRILAHIDGPKNIRLISRNGKDWTTRFKVIADALAKLPIKTAILDGEVVSLDAHGISNFQQLQNSLKTGDTDPLVYYIFDAPYLNGYDLTAVPLIDRKQILASVLQPFNPENVGRLRYSDHIQGQGDSVLQHACLSAMEGIIAKRGDSTYQQSRSSSWLKVKCIKQQEFVIGGYSKAEGSRVGFGALLLGYYQGDELKYAGRVGTGFTTKSLKEIAAELKKRRIEKTQFADPPTGAESRDITWVRPELVGEVEFTEWTSAGHLRHPSFQGLREDKPAKQVIREMPKHPKKKNAPLNSKKANAETTVAGVRLTHPDRVLYAEDEFTKLDLAEYYERVADWILPYVADRPLTLVRCPEGYAGQCFFQKHLTGSLPDAVRGVMVEVKGKQEEYVAIDDVAGLVALVQMGVLELHPWPAREDNLEKPDQLVFDLDPGEGMEWKGVVQGARDVRERLESTGLTTFLRTSGGKGLHVVVPLSRRNDWETCKAFAKSVADAMTREAPDCYVATMSKAKRRGKLFIDYLRNQRGATAIACYSTRRRRGAPVAAPLSWDELSVRTKPDMYNIANLPKRLDKLKADPWAGFFKTRQSITKKILAAFE